MSLFKCIRDDKTCQSLLSSRGHIRLYPHGEAPEGVAFPYAVYQVISGRPLSCVNSNKASTDDVLYQIDVYDTEYNRAHETVNAMRSALEYIGRIETVPRTTRDGTTKHWRCSFDVSVYENRSQ